MRIKHKPKRRHYDMEHDVIEKFLWLPLRINDETRWLEKARIAGFWKRILWSWEFHETYFKDNEQ